MKPGALTDLLREVAAAPEQRETGSFSLSPGTVVGHFEIVRELDRGGFGVVYEAKDRELGRPVALKVVRPGRIVEEEGKASREAEAIARLSHPNLITLFEVGRGEHGPFLVFELLRGKTLDMRIEEGPLPVQEAVHIATEVARGLGHAHAEGVIHRDLKPANVFVTTKGQVKILDFGMAHAFGRRRLSGGTPAYMAPEQWDDDPADERTDVFALGVMIYRMLTGEFPYAEGQGRWAAEATTVRKLDVPGAPELADLVERMLDRTPKGRPRDGAAVLAALTPIEERLRAKPADGKPPEHAKRRKASFGDLLAELKRRQVFRVMIGYGIFSFAVLQATEPIMHGADLPSWVLKAVLVALVLGFPVAVILAWVYDLTSQGVKRTPSAMGRGVSRFGTSRLLLPLSVSAVVLAIGAVGAGGWYAWRHAAEHPRAEGVQGAGPSIAVLPFTDLSPGKDQEYLSDGIAEEILNALTRIEGLKVIGRTSSFSFKGKNVPAGEVARVLGVKSLLEGSVRRDGKRIRVSAHLVNPADGSRLWTESYDRDLGAVLAMQDDIARSVAGALQVKLLRPAAAGRGAAPEAYTEYLLALQIMRQVNSAEDARRARGHLEKAVALDPGLAPAWARLATNGMDWPPFTLPRTPQQRAEDRERRFAMTNHAIALAPRDSDGYSARGFLRMTVDQDWTGARSDLDDAVRYGPSNGLAFSRLGFLLLYTGRREEALRSFQRAIDVDPLAVTIWSGQAIARLVTGDLGGARKSAERALQLVPGHSISTRTLAMADLLDGYPEKVLEAVAREQSEEHRTYFTALAEHSLGHADASAKALEAYSTRFGTENPVIAAGAYAWCGRPDEAFAWLDRGLAGGQVRGEVAVLPTLRSLHADPRWKTLLRRMNLPVD